MNYHEFFSAVFVIALIEIASYFVIRILGYDIFFRNREEYNKKKLALDSLAALRTEVKIFAVFMENRLRDFDDTKGGWDECSLYDLSDMLTKNQMNLSYGSKWEKTHGYPNSTMVSWTRLDDATCYEIMPATTKVEFLLLQRKEAIDVANYAMMIEQKIMEQIDILEGEKPQPLPEPGGKLE